MDKIVYQIYPKSFCDSNNDGIGDINGIISKLDYIKKLNVDFIWLTPIFKSPQNDNGYDVEDYYKIDEIFGTIKDLENLVLECDKRNISIMFDMVFNHTSTHHTWFKKAVSGDKYYQDFYHFSSTKVNWESKFGGSAFSYIKTIDKYYLHLFDETQADLNWHNQNVRKELYKVVNYWLDFGIKGFRFDVINLIGKKQPFSDGDKLQYTDLEIVHDFLSELRKNTYKDRNDIFTVGEMSSTTINNCKRYANSDRLELDTVFNFHHLKVDYKDGYKWSTDYFDYDMLKELLITWQEGLSSSANMSLFWSNHDQPRIASRFIDVDNKQDQLKKNKLLFNMMYLLKGNKFIYQGEELGMKNVDFENLEQINDVEALNYYNSNKKLGFKPLSQKSRDNSRTIMQWDNTEYGGFSQSIPWIMKNNNNISALDQEIGDSTLNYYRKMLNFCKKDVFTNGEIEFINDDVFSFYRYNEVEKYLIICNLSLVSYELKGIVGKIVVSNSVTNSLDMIDALGSIIIKI